MRYILNPSTARVYEIRWESDGKTLAEPEKVNANSPFDALLWWLSGFDEEKFAVLQDIEISCTTSLLNTLCVWVGEEEILIRDISEFETDEERIDCEQLIADRRAERKRKKAERQKEREAEQAEQKKELDTKRALAQLRALQEGVLGLQTDIELSTVDSSEKEYIAIEEDELG